MSLNLIVGPMFSGKSGELIKTIRVLKKESIEYLVIKPRIDNRYTEEGYIVTHYMDKEKCLCITDMKEVFDLNIKDIKYLIIDEGQFINNLVPGVKKLVDDYNINVIIAGLDGDFNREPIGDILELIPFADQVIKKNAICGYIDCNNNAIFTYKKSNDNSIVDVGSNEKYMSMCRTHYTEAMNIKNNVENINNEI